MRKDLTKTLALCLAVVAAGCSKPPQQVAIPAPKPTPSAGYRDPMSVTDPAEQQRIRDENSKKFMQWDYKPSEGKAWTP